jgi:hypothetical protein
MSRALIGLVLAVVCSADTWTGVERVVAVGDLHGDLAQFTQVLQAAGLVDHKLKWKGGKTHLVQLGDVPDRGPETRKVMDLLMDLEKQAKKTGGRVHALIGNHEAMNIYGDLRYTIPEEFAAFKTRDSEQIRVSFFKLHLEELQNKGERASDVYQKQWEEKYPLGFFEHRYEFGPNGKYYRWIVGHDAVIRVNDTLFLHGGISPKYAAMTRSDMNRQIISELKNYEKLATGTGIVADEEGPLWYRGLANGNEQELESHLESVLNLHGVKRIVIGHTPTAGAILPRFGGRVILADVGITKAYGSRSACLVIEKDTLAVVHRGRRLAFPSNNLADLIRYLKEAASADPAPSPLAPVLAQLDAGSVK